MKCHVMEPDEVDEVLDAIAEGKAVDWERLQRSKTLRRSDFAVLEALAQIRRDHRAGEEVRPSRQGAALEAGFEILEPIGKGAFGEVHRALDCALKREVAIKELRPGRDVSSEIRARFIEEARILSRLDHPNVVRVYSVAEFDGRIRIVLELVDGMTLERIVREAGPFSPVEAAHMGADLCRALAALHAEGILHQDVKPSNVMRAKGGRIVLLDFGVARSSAPGAAEDTPVTGTPLFMAPELLEGRAGGDPSTDLYSLGVLLYWSVSGRYPFEADSPMELHRKVREEPPMPLVDRCPQAPAAFVEIVARTLARDPAQRFRSAGALEAELRAFLAGAVPKRPAEGKKLRRRRALAIGLGLGLLAAAIPAWILLPKAFGRAPLAVEAQLFLRREGKDVRLREGDPIGLGDELFLEVRAEEDFHCYVFNEDDAGHLYTLFPLTDFVPTNPLPGQTKHQLPGRYEPPDQPNSVAHYRTWQVTTRGKGSERFLIVASREPVAAAEKLRREIPEASPDAKVETDKTVADLSRGTQELLRGVGGTAAARPSRDDGHERPRASGLRDIFQPGEQWRHGDSESSIFLELTTRE